MSTPITAILALDDQRQLHIYATIPRKPEEGCLLLLVAPHKHPNLCELKFLISAKPKRSRRRTHLHCIVWRNNMRINQHTGSPDAILDFVQVVVWNELSPLMP